MASGFIVTIAVGWEGKGQDEVLRPPEALRRRLFRDPRRHALTWWPFSASVRRVLCVTGQRATWLHGRNRQGGADDGRDTSITGSSFMNDLIGNCSVKKIGSRHALEAQNTLGRQRRRVLRPFAGRSGEVRGS